jgi:hypothetical protein
VTYAQLSLLYFIYSTIDLTSTVQCSYEASDKYCTMRLWSKWYIAYICWLYMNQFSPMTCLLPCVSYFEDKVFPVHAMNTYTVTRAVAPLVLNLSFRWMCVVNSCLGQLTPRRETCYPVQMRLGRFQRQSGCFAKEKNVLPLPVFELRLSSPYPNCCINYATAAYIPYFIRTT